MSKEQIPTLLAIITFMVVSTVSYYIFKNIIQNNTKEEIILTLEEIILTLGIFIVLYFIYRK